MQTGSSHNESAAFRRQFVRNIVAVIAVGMVAHLFRSSVAVVAPDILADVGLGRAWAAYLTSAFFITAVVTQIPAGMLFDGVGVRLTIPAMLLTAALGALVFAVARSTGGLIVGRALMGIGAGALIMGGIALLARWMQPERFASVVGMVLSLSQIGNIGATAPVALMAAILGWRGAFIGLAVLSLAVAVAYLLLVRERPEGPRIRPCPEGNPGFRQSVLGSLRILADRQLWPVFAMAFVSYSTNFSIAGVWGGVYLNEVFHLDLVARGNILFMMVSAYALGLFFFGWLGQRIQSLKRSVIIGTVLSTVLLVVAALMNEPPIWSVSVLFVLFGAASGACGTIIPHGRNFYPTNFIGRGVTVMNTIVLLGALFMQIATGRMMGALSEVGFSAPDAFRILFGFHAMGLLVGLAVYGLAREHRLSAHNTAP